MPMRAFLLLLFLFACCSSYGQISQVEYDILKVRFAEQIKSERFEDALQSLGEIRSSGYQYPDSLDYFEGFALHELDRLVEAQAAYKNFLEKAGSGSSYYTRTLQKLVSLEEPIKEALASYKAALANDADDATLQRHEKKLGPIAVPMRAEWQAIKDKQAAVERVAAEAEAARLAELRAERMSGPYELAHDYGEATTVSTGDLAFLPDGTVIAVGSIRYPDCIDNKSNLFVVHFDMSGEIISDRKGCSTNENHAFYQDVHVTPDGRIIAVGTTDERGTQLGGVAQINPDGSVVWTNRLDLQGTKKKYRDYFGGSVFWGSMLAENGRVYAVGSTWNKKEGKRQQRLVVYSTDGQYLWDNASMENDGAVHHNIVEHEPGRYTMVGYLEKRERKRGFLEVYGRWFGSPDTFLKQHKDAWGTEFVDAAPTSDGGTMVIGTSTGADKQRFAYLLRFNRKGKKQWSKVLREYGNTWPRRILRHGDGFVINGGVDVSGNWQGWLLKVNESGDVLWSEAHGGDGGQFILSLKPLPDGTGFLGVGTDTGNPWILKLDNEGTLNRSGVVAKE